MRAMAQGLDPSIPQRQAADPRVSSWVSASAGTGKTKVLTDRLLNLMLLGNDPGKILCLTFTKAAAAEMTSRLFTKLRQWVLLDEAVLIRHLEEVIQAPVTPVLIKRARSLFTEVIDLPQGMRILTIHGFCQSLLRAFPLEARVSPQFSLVDEASASLHLKQAMAEIFSKLGRDSLGQMVPRFFRDTPFQDFIQGLLDHRHSFRELIHALPTTEHFAKALCKALELPYMPDFQEEGAWVFFKEPPHPALEKHLDNILVAQWYQGTPLERQNIWEDYKRLFLTKDGGYLKRLKVDCPEEAERVGILHQRLCALEIMQKSLIIFHFGREIFHRYQDLKFHEGLLDYDDLIDKTMALLHDPQMAAWVLFKLDGGIDHILIDEAQDTNPAQWRVVQLLTEELFRPEKNYRTLFVVGDAKQSIYGFQGASPEDFITLRQHFSQRTQQIGQQWRDVDLQVSFRSTPPVLGLVDKVFSCPVLRGNLLSEAPIVHHPYRCDHEGAVSLWPLVLNDETEEENFPPWTLPSLHRGFPSSEDLAARKIAKEIKGLLGECPIMASTGKPLEPRDVLILVKKRGRLMETLISALRREGVPVAGADRFLLTSHLAVQDLIVLGDFLLQPQDDLSLATLLRSPLGQLPDDLLEELCYHRGEKSLWSFMQDHVQGGEAPLALQEIVQWLKMVLSHQDYQLPFELYHTILYQWGAKEKFLSLMGEEAEEALQEFLAQALTYENMEPPTLQGFLTYLKKNPVDLKRDIADQQLNQVRLMTIHGSKGLQAPLVIVVEKVDGRSQQDKILWCPQGKKGYSLMIARPSGQVDVPFTTQVKRTQKELEEAEDKRLLYVALTRAQDHLYMCGYGNKNTEGSWYSILEKAGMPLSSWREENTLYACGQQKEVQAVVPAHFKTPFVAPKNKILDTQEEKLSSSVAIERGIFIHKLLEDVGSLPSQWRHQAVKKYLETHNASKEFGEDILNLALDIFEKYGEFFTEESVAELELLDPEGKLLRLDRVLWPKNERLPISILDFKTTPHIPRTPQVLNEAIKKQLLSYKEVVQALAPHREVQTYVLWVQGPRLDLITLEEAKK